jgi:hypothetical protein
VRLKVPAAYHGNRVSISSRSYFVIVMLSALSPVAVPFGLRETLAEKPGQIRADRPTTP